jgi:four helix bundle protein
VYANIAEGWGRRTYLNKFKKFLIYSMGSLEETKVWLQFARDCKYMTIPIYNELSLKCDEIGAKIYKLHENWKSF